MGLDLVQWERFLFHITHEKNVPNILATGIFSTNERKRQKLAHVSIADAGIQARRSAKPVPVGRGGTVHDYVPLFFGARSPMLYAVKAAVPQNEVFYVLVDWTVLNEPSTVFTDGNAATAGTNFFCGVQDLDKVDQAAAAAIRWDKPPELRRRKSAEVLVWKHVPVDQLRWLVVMDELAAERAKTMIKNFKASLRVHVAPEYYYR